MMSVYLFGIQVQPGVGELVLSSALSMKEHILTLDQPFELGPTLEVM